MFLWLGLGLVALVGGLLWADRPKPEAPPSPGKSGGAPPGAGKSPGGPEAGDPQPKPAQRPKILLPLLPGASPAQVWQKWQAIRDEWTCLEKWGGGLDAFALKLGNLPFYQRACFGTPGDCPGEDKPKTSVGIWKDLPAGVRGAKSFADLDKGAGGLDWNDLNLLIEQLNSTVKLAAEKGYGGCSIASRNEEPPMVEPGKPRDQVEQGKAPGQVVRRARPAPSEATPAVLALRQAIDTAHPRRLTTSDSMRTIAEGPPTDHSEGLALDITYDPVNGPDLDLLLDALWADPRIASQVWRNRIRSRMAPDWKPYCEAGEFCNPHSRHAHFSIDPARAADASAWHISSSSSPSSLQATQLPVPASFADEEPVGHYLRDAWVRGLVDGVEWVPIEIGPFVIEVAAEPFAVQGQRIPISWDDAVAIAGSLGAILPTRELADAIWEAAARRLPHLGPARAPLASWGNARAQNEALGPTGPDLAAGGWVHWILAQPLGVRGAVDYGLWQPNGGVWQDVGRDHGPQDIDALHLLQPVRAVAHADGREINLLDWLARAHEPGEIPGATGRELGGPIAPALLARFRGASP